ncbi:MAG TPA: aspartate-semialdehyde dehydrogenase [Blastocatellia bacterium]|nr:aspartate-semialdehyde dehydrogenase [Blastocatellia bacterium]
MTKQKLRVGILGATGLVGQRLIAMLENHPFFELGAVAASDRSSGRLYSEACPWRLASDIPERAAWMTIQPCAPPLDCDVVISSLPSSIALEAEPAFAAAGYPVISNSSALRMAPDVPLVVPEINSDHLSMIDAQRRSRGWDRGFVLTNPNCSTIALVLALAPLERAFGLETVVATTLQAASGAGYPGVPSMDLIDNVVPFIDGEEPKIEAEPKKILGRAVDGQVVPGNFRVSAQVHRVPVLEGHTVAVRVGLQQRASIAEISEALSSFTGVPQELRLPTAPARPIVVRNEPDRPQPRLDRDVEGGMASVVGRIATDEIFDARFVVLGHNMIRGAAGAALLNAELLVARGML